MNLYANLYPSSRQNLSAIEFTDEYGYNSVIKNVSNVLKPFEISSAI